MTEKRVNVFQTDRLDDVIVVEPLGDETTFRYFDIHNQSNRVMRELDDVSVRGLVVDFRSVEVMGWVMTSAIVRLVRNVDYRGGRTTYCNASSGNANLFSSLHLGQPWSGHDSREAAITALDLATSTVDEE